MIREANSSDIPSIVEMGQRFFDASGYGDFCAYDPASAAFTFEQLIANPDGVIFVAEDDAGLCGAAACLLYPFFFNAAHRHGQEFFWWCDPDARGKPGLLLKSALEEWAKANGAKSFAMAALCSLRPELVGAIYKRAGYRPSDTTYVKGL